MSQENVDRLQRVYAAINEGVDEPLQDLLHPEFVYKPERSFRAVAPIWRRTCSAASLS
jgi:hypothetical protein